MLLSRRNAVLEMNAR